MSEPMPCIVQRQCRCSSERVPLGTYERDCHAHMQENYPTCEVCHSRINWLHAWSTEHFTGHRHCVERAEALL